MIMTTVPKVSFKITMVVTTAATPIRDLIKTALGNLSQTIPSIEIVQVNATPATDVTYRAWYKGAALGAERTLTGGEPVELIGEDVGDAKLSCASGTVDAPAWVCMANM